MVGIMFLKQYSLNISIILFYLIYKIIINKIFKVLNAALGLIIGEYIDQLLFYSIEFSLKIRMIDEIIILNS
jgi:hypothetical protein